MTVAELLPWWVGWAGFAGYLVFLLIQALIAPMLIRWTLSGHRRSNVHWTKHAAQVADVRSSTAVGFLLGSMSALAFESYFRGYASPLPTPVMVGVGLLAVTTASIWNAHRNAIKYTDLPVPRLPSYTVRVLSVWWPVAVFFALAIIAPSSFTSPWMLVWLPTAVGAFFSLKLIIAVHLRTGVLTPAPQWVVEGAESAATALGVEPPKVLQINTISTNAAALPGQNTVVVAGPLVEILNDREVEAVMIHEIAHLGQRKELTTRMWVGVATYLPLALLKPIASLGVWAVAVAVAVVLVATIIGRRTAAGMESGADDVAVEMSHESAALGTALLKLYQRGQLPTSTRCDGHAPLSERLATAGIVPDFGPRDGRMRLRRAATGMFLGVAIATVAMVGAVLRSTDAGVGSYLTVGLGWTPEYGLTALGEHEATERGDYARALPFFEAAAAEGFYVAEVYRVWALAGDGRCDDAVDAQREIFGVADVDDIEWTTSWILYCYDQFA